MVCHFRPEAHHENVVVHFEAEVLSSEGVDSALRALTDSDHVHEVILNGALINRFFLDFSIISFFLDSLTLHISCEVKHSLAEVFDELVVVHLILVILVDHEYSTLLVVPLDIGA